MREWLKQRRVQMGYTQDDVASKCDIERAYYTMIENGTRNPSVDVAKKIAKVVEVKWTIFFDD